MGEAEQMKQGVTGPRVFERYRGFDIWFDPRRGVYYASHCEHTKSSPSIAEVRRWLDEHKR